MRVIHHSGRTGNAPMLKRLDDFGRHDVQVGVRWDEWQNVAPLKPGPSTGWVTTDTLRPLGPIEEELLRIDPSVAVVPQVAAHCPAHNLFLAFYDVHEHPNDRRGCREHALSEALEACARIWEQHGVAL